MNTPTTSRTDAQIVDEANELAITIAREVFGFAIPDDMRTYEQRDPRVLKAWQAACIAFEHLQATPAAEALENIRDEQPERQPLDLRTGDDDDIDDYMKERGEWILDHHPGVAGQLPHETAIQAQDRRARDLIGGTPMTDPIPDECKAGAPMREHYVRPEHLADMEKIAHASAKAPGRETWTELGLYYRAGFNRPFVAVVIGAVQPDSGKRERFSFFAAGTLARALSWFEPSDLAFQLMEQVPADDVCAQRWPDSNQIAQQRAAYPGLARDAWLAEIAERRSSAQGNTPRLMPGVPLSMRIVGYDGEATLRGVLAWLYPDSSSDAARAAGMALNFGMPARTVRRALQIEAQPDAGGQAPWVAMFVNAMRCFDRDLWRAGIGAGQATVADVDR